jgi:hypothetical protein
MLDKFLPPTDNLYKFLSITGLLLIVLSFYPTYLTLKFEEQRIEQDKNHKMFMAEVKILEQQNEDYKLFIEKGLAPTKSIQQIREELLNQEKKRVELGIADDLLLNNAKLINYFDRLSSWVFWSGIICMLIGFWCWYFKIQRPNDLILMNQSQNKEPTNPKRVKRVRPI